MNHYVTFLGTTVHFDVADDAAEHFRPVHRFFRHVVSDSAPDAVSGRPAPEPTFRIAVRAYHPAEVASEVWATEQAVIRRSSAAEFNFDAHIVDRGDRRLYINRATLLDTPVDALRDNVFELRITAGSTIQVLDFVRDLIIRHEETRGTVVLHASGAYRGDEAVVIAGPKGAGKTTTLLSVLQRPGWRYFTGDKAFCEFTDDGVLVHPWRDYPYVGVGTIRSNARLMELARRADPGLDDRPDGHKILMDPDTFESWLGGGFDATPRRLAAVLLPEVRPGERMRHWELTRDNERWAYLNKMIDRQVDTTFFTWQSYLVPDYTAFYRSLALLRRSLTDIAMVRLRGTLDVDPDTVLGHRLAGAGR